MLTEAKIVLAGKGESFYICEYGAKADQHPSNNRECPWRRPQFEPRGHHHWFTGDGMIHAFCNRYVRTPKWRLEYAAGKAPLLAWLPWKLAAGLTRIAHEL